MAFTVCTVNDMLCSYTLNLSDEQFHIIIKKKTFNRGKKRHKKPQEKAQNSQNTPRHCVRWFIVFHGIFFVLHGIAFISKKNNRNICFSNILLGFVLHLNYLKSTPSPNF